MILFILLFCVQAVAEDFCDVREDCSGESNTEAALVQRILDSARVKGHSTKDIRELVDLVRELMFHQSPLPPIPQDEDRVKKLERHCRQNFALSKAVEFRSDPSSGVGVYALENMAERTLISKVYTNDTFSSILHGQEFNCLQQPQDDDVPPYLWRREMFKLLQQRVDGKPSVFIQSLPQEPLFVAWFSADDFEFLRGSSAFTRTVDLFRVVCRKYALIHQQLQTSSSCAEESRLPLSKFTFVAFRWAFAMTVSRTIGIASGATKEQDVLVPCIDLVNHASFAENSQIQLNVDKAETSTESKSDDSKSIGSKEYIMLETTKAVKKGEQLFIKYGNLDASSALALYQFLLFEAYCMTLHLDESEMTEKAVALMNSNKIYDLNIVFMKRPRGSAAEYGAQFSDDEMNLLHKLANQEFDEPPLTPQTLRNTWRFIAKQLKHAIDAFPNERGFYVQQLKDQDISEIRRLLIQYMIEEIDLVHTLHHHSVSMLG